MDFFSLILFFILGTPVEAPHHLSHHLIGASESDTDRGAGIDPNGATIEEGDRGAGIDPDGLEAGAEIDPDGAS